MVVFPAPALDPPCTCVRSLTPTRGVLPPVTVTHTQRHHALQASVNTDDVMHDTSANERVHLPHVTTLPHGCTLGWCTSLQYNNSVNHSGCTPLVHRRTLHLGAFVVAPHTYECTHSCVHLTRGAPSIESISCWLHLAPGMWVHFTDGASRVHPARSLTHSE